MRRATLFDFNGVLVDDERIHLAAFREVLEPLGVTLEERLYWERYLGFDDAGAFHAALSDAGRSPTEAEVRQLIEQKRPIYLALAARELPVFEGAAALVERRAALGPVVIVSGALREEIELGLRVLGVRERVTAVVSAEDTARSKPDPQGYLLARALLAPLIGEPSAARALVFEDSLAGVQAGVAAGLRCVGLAHSYPEPRLREVGAALTFAHIREVTDEALAPLEQA